MKRLILFRYHKNAKVCENRLKLLRRFNPKLDIFGLYGGEEKKHGSFVRKFGDLIKSSYCIKNKSSHWKWKNSDLAVREWYLQRGRKISFDFLNIVEWDLAMFEPLGKIYKDISNNKLFLTGLIPLEKIEKKWSWTSEEPEKSEWNSLLGYVKEKFNYDKKPFASLGPGIGLPKKFLDKYSKTEIPELVHDELRLPLFGQIFGFELQDTKFYDGWLDKSKEKYFNCVPRDISPIVIKKELLKTKGRRVFHPFRGIWKI